MPKSASGITAWISDTVRSRGVVGTVATALRLAIQPILGRQSVLSFGERRFDRRYGVDTAGIIPREDLKIDGPAAAHAVHYQPSPPVLLKEAVADLRIDYRRYTFVDFGCGKGKALLMASAFPFKKIIGVELAADLAAIAAANIKKYKSRRQRCRAIEAVCMDAAKLPLPDTPVVCFFYNPFKEEIMARVLENLRESLRRRPRDMIVVYLYPELERLFDQASFLVNTRRRPWCCIYRYESIEGRRSRDATTAFMEIAAVKD